MGTTMRQVGALALGSVSFAIAVGIVLGLDRALDFNLFTLMLWGFVPAGAFATGLVAASGFYFGSVRLDARPSAWLAWAMLAVAAATQAALYYGQYALAATPDGQRVRDLVGFGPFVAFLLTQARYGLSVHGAALGEGVRVGWVGYVIAAVQFVGLAAGTLGVYALLADRAFCEACGRFTTSVRRVLAPLGSVDERPSLEGLRAAAPLSPDYFARLVAAPAAPPAVGVELELVRCPACARQALVERPMAHKDGKWSGSLEPTRTLWGEAGQDLDGALAAGGGAAPPP
jgi:hypothetical protein